MTRTEAPLELQVDLGVATPFRAGLVIAALLALTIAGVWMTTGGRRPIPHAGHSDAVLYQTIIDDVRHGAPYYKAATQEQRRYHYPLRPFVAVRPPLLAVAMAALPNEIACRLAFGALAIGTLGAWGVRLARSSVAPLDLTLALLLVGSGAMLAFAPTAYTFHEAWAGLLIALSLALRRSDRWALSLAVGLVAALTRELAAAYLLAMAAMAWRDGCRREAVAWLGGLAVIAAALVQHAAAVSAQLLPGDLPSEGWVKVGGWSFVLATIHWNALLIAALPWVRALVAPLALLGLAAWRGPLGERVALTVFGYVAAFLVAGRPENSYWGLLIAPLWPLGLLLAPKVLIALARTFGRQAAAPALTPP